MNKPIQSEKRSSSRTQFLKLLGIGVGSVLSLSLGAGNDIKRLLSSNPSSQIKSFTEGPLSRPPIGGAFSPLLTEFTDTIRSTGKADPTSGVGTEINYDSSNAAGNILALDRGANPDVYKGLRLWGQPVQIYANGALAVQIDYNLFGQRVGINPATGAFGTIAPYTELHVVRYRQSDLGPILTLMNPAGGGGAGAAIDFDGAYRGESLAPSARIRSLDAGNWSSNIVVYTKVGGVSTNSLAERMRITHDGNIGIDKANPGYRLHVVDNTDFEILAIESSHTVGARMIFNPTAQFGRRYDICATANDAAEGAGKFIIRDALSGTRFTILSSGHIGIGTQTPQYLLDVAGDIRATGAIYANANGTKYFQGGDDAALHDINVANTIGIYGVQSTAEGHIKLGSAGPTISGKSSNLGVGTSTPGYLLDVAGQAHATSFPTSSDERFKENIVPLVDVLDKVARLKGYTFEWNQLHASTGRSKWGQKEIGLIAQEVQKVFPEVVTTWRLDPEDPTDYLSVDYGRLVAVLISAVNELAVRVAKLQPAT